jgi:hypothetical protein
MSQQWSRFECEAIVADYLAMLHAGCRGEPYSKADHRRLLKQQLDGEAGPGGLDIRCPQCDGT